jgi:methyl-accepting chemotaxis protein
MTNQGVRRAAMGISNLRIPTKIVAGLLALALVSVGSVISGGITARNALEQARIIRDGLEASALSLARANQQAFRAGDIAYRGVSRSEPAEIRELFGRFEQSRREFVDLVGEAKRGLPARSADFERYVTDLDAVLVVARQVGELAASGRRDAALSLLSGGFDQRIDTLKNAIARDIAGMEKEIGRLADRADADASSALFTQALSVGVGIVVVLAVMVWMSLACISRPLGRLERRMAGLARGELEAEVDGAGRGDEIGAMARAVAVFRTNAIEMRRLEAEQAAAAGRLEAEKKRTMHELADRFEKAVGGIVTLVSSAATELQTAAATLTSAAEETSAQSMAVSSASEEASTNVQTVAASTEELASSVREIARQVQQSSEIAGRAESEAEGSNVEVGGLAGAVEKIGSIVGLIRDIAAQTNLLALNATIEAARAGAAGRGFAVVASEVKGLAEQTAKATAEIGGQIGAVQVATRAAADRIGVVGSIIRDMNRISTTIAGAVEEQSAATQEIARTVQQASQGTKEVSSNIVGVTRAAEESSSAASQVLSAAEDLARQAELLGREVDCFLAGIRAA